MRTLSLKHFLLMNALLLILSACGFHLQNSLHLPPSIKTVYLQSFSPDNNLTKALRSALKFSKLKVVDTAKEASFSIELLNENFSTAQTTVGGDDQLQNYLATYSITFTIKNAKGDTLVGPKTIQSQQNIQVLKNEVLNNSNKAIEAQEELTRRVISQLLAYLSAKDTIQGLTKK